MKQRQEQEKAMKKKLEEQKLKDLALVNTQIIQKVPFGVDPKTVLCENFKNKNCTNKRCRFSHDLNVGRKTEKASIYEDQREQKNQGMEDWSQNDLEEAITKQEGSHNANLNRQTDIVCKFFLEAIETRKYGWFWEW
jgi:hypothetical protein